MAQPVLKALCPTRDHKGKRHGVGETFPTTKKHAARLIKLGTAEQIEVEETVEDNEPESDA